MNRLYEARWQNAIKQANKINALIDKGYVLLRDGDKVNQFKVDDGPWDDGDDAFDIPCVYEDPGNNCKLVCFEKSTYFDDGTYTPIKEYNDKFWDGIEVLKRVSVNPRRVRVGPNKSG